MLLKKFIFCYLGHSRYITLIVINLYNILQKYIFKYRHNLLIFLSCIKSISDEKWVKKTKNDDTGVRRLKVKESTSRNVVVQDQGVDTGAGVGVGASRQRKRNALIFSNTNPN